MKSNLIGKKAIILFLISTVLAFGSLALLNVYAVAPYIKEVTAEEKCQFRFRTENIGDDEYISISGVHWTSEVVEIPDTIKDKPVKVINENAFQSINYKEIIVPNSVVEIKENAFIAPNLEKVIIYGYNVSLAPKLFDNNANITIYAPKGSTAEKYAYENGLTFEELP